MSEFDFRSSSFIELFREPTVIGKLVDNLVVGISEGVYLGLSDCCMRMKEIMTGISEVSSVGAELRSDLGEREAVLVKVNRPKSALVWIGGSSQEIKAVSFVIKSFNRFDIIWE